MDANDLHIKPGGSLLEKIAADPEMINRPLGAKAMPKPEPKPGLTAPADQVAGYQATPASPVVLLHPDEHLPAAAPVKGHKIVLLLVAAGVILLLSGGGTAAYYMMRPAPAAVPVIASPTPTPEPEPTEEPVHTPLPTGSVPYGSTPTPSPTPTPTPTPTPAPASRDVTAPAAAPSASHPQTVTVKNPSGLWLRSSQDSSKKSNIIAWMPNGAQVSVDSIGNFWWHGTYNGKTGYFAVNYTK